MWVTFILSFDELAKFEKEKLVLRIILIYTRDAPPLPVSWANSSLTLKN